MEKGLLTNTEKWAEPEGTRRWRGAERGAGCGWRKDAGHLVRWKTMANNTDLKGTCFIDHSFKVENFSPPPSPEAGNMAGDNGSPKVYQFETLTPAQITTEARAFRTVTVAMQELGLVSVS